MAKFSAKLILSDASELDELIFKKGQVSLQQELNDFVEEFETKEELLELDSLAKTYVQLTSCDQKLKSAVSTQAFETTLEKSTLVHNSLAQILEAVEQMQTKKMAVPFQSEREAYIVSKEERKKAIENEIRRESDKIDEYYAKKTRDSIYQNLVGGNQYQF